MSLKGPQDLVQLCLDVAVELPFQIFQHYFQRPNIILDGVLTQLLLEKLDDEQHARDDYLSLFTGNNVDLQWLNISYLKLTEKGLEAMQQQNLLKVDLPREDPVRFLTRGINEWSCQNLRHLSCNDTEPDALIKKLEVLPSLTCYRVMYSCMQQHHLLDLCNVLGTPERSKHLTHLELGQLNIPDLSPLEKLSPHLTHLKLCNLMVQIVGFDRTLSQLSKLQHLDVSVLPRWFKQFVNPLQLILGLDQGLPELEYLDVSFQKVLNSDILVEFHEKHVKLQFLGLVKCLEEPFHSLDGELWIANELSDCHLVTTLNRYLGREVYEDFAMGCVKGLGKLPLQRTVALIDALLPVISKRTKGISGTMALRLLHKLIGDVIKESLPASSPKQLSENEEFNGQLLDDLKSSQGFADFSAEPTINKILCYLAKFRYQDDFLMLKLKIMSHCYSELSEERFWDIWRTICAIDTSLFSEIEKEKLRESIVSLFQTEKMIIVCNAFRDMMIHRKK